MNSGPFTADRSAALAVRPPGVPSVWDDVQLQHLWLAMQQRSWRSVAIVGASKGVSTIETANVLAKMAWWYSGAPSGVFDLRDLSLRLLEHQLRGLADQYTHGTRIFMALRSTFENPTAVPLARAADAAILCVELGTTDTKSAERTVNTIGRERFLGTIIIGGAQKAATKQK